MGIVNLIRYGLLGALLLFSIITLGLSANLVAAADGEVIPTFWGLDLAVSVITVVVVIPSIVIDFFRAGAFTSMVVVELAWAGVLMVLWIAAAGQTTATMTGNDCNFVGLDAFGDVIGPDSAAESFCHQAQALEGFTWLNFLILLAWLVTLITFSAIAHNRGNSAVWTSSVTGTDFRARNGPSVPQQRYQEPNVNPGQPMQQQNTGYSQGYPPAQGYNSPAAPAPGNPYSPGVAHV